MMWNESDLLTVACEVISFIDNDTYKIQRCRYGNSNGTTREVLKLLRTHSELNNRTDGALLVQIGACTTGCYVKDTKWNENKNAKRYNEIFNELF